MKSHEFIIRLFSELREVGMRSRCSEGKGDACLETPKRFTVHRLRPVCRELVFPSFLWPHSSPPDQLLLRDVSELFQLNFASLFQYVASIFNFKPRKLDIFICGDFSYAHHRIRPRLLRDQCLDQRSKFPSSFKRNHLRFLAR